MMTYYQRNLPHWHPPAQDLFITWRLKGSLPRHLQVISSKAQPGRRFLDLDRALDRAESGPLWLQDSRVARFVIDALQIARSNQLIELHAYVVMANHVHALLSPHAPVAKITQFIKGATARRVNLLLGLTGNPFWQDESFDHWVRNPGEWQKIRAYIEHNPVAAGLAARPEDWPWSSASHPPE